MTVSERGFEITSWLAGAILALTFPCCPIANAKGLGQFLHDAVDTSIKVATAPTETLINGARVAVGQKPAQTIFDPANGVGTSAGKTLQNGTSIAAQPAQALYQRAQREAAKAGRGTEFVFDVATFAQRYQDDLVTTSAYMAGNILQQQNPTDILGIPLAAAIREGRARFSTKARLIPVDVRNGLKGFYAKGTLERAKFAVGTIEISLPSLLGDVQKFGDEAFAVTVDDIIVFNRDPPSFEDNPWWWGHEVTHVEQYMQLGIDKFAARYVKTAGADLENPANRRGDAVLDHARNDDNVSNDGLAAEHGADVDSEELPVPQAAPNDRRDRTPVGSGFDDPAIIYCQFLGQSPGVEFFVTRLGRIIVVDKDDGRWVQIGWATPPKMPIFAWHYQVSNGYGYDVLPDGKIVAPGMAGVLGVAYRLQ